MTCMHKQRDRRPGFAELMPALLAVHRRLGGELPRLGRELFAPGLSRA